MADCNCEAGSRFACECAGVAPIIGGIATTWIENRANREFREHVCDAGV